VLAAIFCISFGLRLGAAVLLPNIHHPDEIFQSLEQAHRVVFGYGIVPWEFRDGARSWLLPGLLAAPMWLGDRLAPQTHAYLYFPLVLIAALSASTVVLAYCWGRTFGRTHAWLAVVVLATWFELIYFGAKAFGEVVASCFLFAGAFACSVRGEKQPGIRAFIAGVCLGFAFDFRFHLAPAIALAALWHCRGDFRDRWLPLIAGAAVPLAVLGLTDWITWSVPFGSVITNFKVNILDARSHSFGVSPAYWYWNEFTVFWGWASALLGLLALWGVRRDPLPLLLAIVIVLAHSVVEHKEYRFIYPALPLLLFSASQGSAEICAWFMSRRPRAGLGIAAFAGLAWLATSGALAGSHAMRPLWSRALGGVELMSRARTEASCGVAIYKVSWAWTGGYTWLHAPLPIHQLTRAAWDTNAFDAWIAPASAHEPRDAGFTLNQCVSRMCLWTRHGPCHRDRWTEVQNVMEAYGQ
jgi:hypothetical protein